MNYAEVIAAHKSGRPVGIYSVCSADPTTPQGDDPGARRRHGHPDRGHSNQVDQFGGYTGLTPAGFQRLRAQPGRRGGPAA